MQDVEKHIAAIIRSHCSIETKVNDVHPNILAAMLAAAASVSGWRIMVQQAPKRLGGEFVGYLEKDNELKIVGFWSSDGKTVQPEFVKWAESTVQSIWDNLGSPSPEDYFGYVLFVYCLPAALIWWAPLYFVPPIWHGLLEFGRSFGIYWWVGVAVAFGLTVYIWAQLLSTFQLYIRLGSRSDLYLIEQFRVRSKAQKAK